MKCPNCEEYPTNIIHDLKLKGVGFTKSIEGFLRCKHCDQVLKYRRHFNILVAHRLPFYWLGLLLFSLFGLGLHFVVTFDFSVVGTYNIPPLLFFVSLVGFIFLSFSLPFFYLSRKYAIVELSNEEELHSEIEIGEKYQVMFINFCILALLGSAAVFYVLYTYITNILLFALILFSYLSLTVFIGFKIMQKTKTETQFSET